MSQLTPSTNTSKLEETSSNLKNRRSTSNRHQEVAPPSPLALTPCLPAELLSYVLQQAHSTALVICGTRRVFLSSLLEATSFSVPQSQTQQDPDCDSELSQTASLSHSPLNVAEGEPSTTRPQTRPLQPSLRHPLLIPTLHQISIGRHTNTAFTPTVSHLRAYLSVFSAANSLMREPICLAYDTADIASQHPLLIAYGLVELHRGTSEWSTQGLGSTCAALVEAGRRSGRRVVLVERRRGESEKWRRGVGENADNDAEEKEEWYYEGIRTEGTGMEVRARVGKGIWHEKLPILSGSVRRPGAEMEYGGRTVEVGAVLRRWFKFGRGQWEDFGSVGML